ncbi:5-formyltetrahydrofolate cyclo-ligase [Gordonia sp. NB41Y]|uniref:5-formyltetrahydrofolate cyclo-ligase n=1 Tax=Gordonia sp. NB41Y TaxID=875808 RepID=UPI0002BDBAE6|nr:5-formyltetrahydrofolate cyclo-ligase [Gordonia sp. NB41Y]EMP13587.1 5-formyltetrahydrofolate cyclo-ligase [Gordonia sp. NB41Y]WLP91862.1 5-formyltetrahydrofolate cyclo-ligase [Gordonia sp. NB41Y]
MSKTGLRADFSNRRAQMTREFRENAAEQLVKRLSESPFAISGETVGAYVPVGSEPGSVRFLDILAELGATVLLPVVPDGDPAPLNWVAYDPSSSLERRRWGLLEPAGGPLGVDAIDIASVIFVPALAVDAAGVRLGRGAGYYDRTIHRTAAELVAVVYDHEVVDELPGDPHDIPMGWALTPGGGFRRLG